MSRERRQTKIGIDQALHRIRQQAGDDMSALGTMFERLVRHYFRCMPRLSNERVQNVVLWKDWQGRTERDTGIDIVVKAIVNGKEEHWAVQAKYRAPGKKIALHDVTNAIAAATRSDYQFTRLYLATTVDLTNQARASFGHRTLHTSVIDLDRLDQADYRSFFDNTAVTRKPLELRRHQRKALDDVIAGLRRHDRGQLIMACGTGKTLTSLRIAEQQCGKGKHVLLLVPSISLMHQTIMEWSTNLKLPMAFYPVCSDRSTGQGEATEVDLQMPADTAPAKLAKKVACTLPNKPMRVVFATYQSLNVVSRAQRAHGLPRFDLVICDEAHYTAGVDKNTTSPYKAIHDAAKLVAQKRLYMTATPVIYGDTAKADAQANELLLYSMDRVDVFGPVLHRLDFSKAISRKLLADYRLCVFMMKPSEISAMLKNVEDIDDVIDTVKMVGAWCGLSKLCSQEAADFLDDPAPMKRAVFFSNTVKCSRKIKDEFNAVVESYRKDILGNMTAGVNPVVEHVDGTMNGAMRAIKLKRLRDEPEPGACNLLTNARCLTEGVDVPALDAVIFYEPRAAQIDIVQALGRAMRVAKGKKRGYIILPIAIPEDTDVDVDIVELCRNMAFRPIIQIAAALKAHDSSFTVRIDELVKVYTPLTNPVDAAEADADESSPDDGDPSQPGLPKQLSLGFEMQHKIHAMIVKELGDRKFWPVWATDVDKIVKEIIRRMRAKMINKKSSETKAFNFFVADLQGTLHARVTPDEALEMVAQHIVTRPIFAESFKGHVFSRHNTISKSIDNLVLAFDKDCYRFVLKPLDGFYKSVAAQFRKGTNLKEKQEVMVDLYHKFFKKAFPRVAEKFDVVYTPVEIVDFIIRGCDHLLRRELDKDGLAEQGVHILDPFTGIGTFLVRLLQGDLISDAVLPLKYSKEIHANEIMLLPFYIASVNIEECYHARLPGSKYRPFRNLVHTDTFKDNLHLLENRAQAASQGRVRTWVIMGNPPYSIGQRSQNDGNKNTSHADLERRIQETYAKHSKAKLKRALYDSYVKSIRWSTDRLGEDGVIAFVSNGSFIESAAFDGLRKCLVQEFHKIYCFNLRGNIRAGMQQADLRKAEGENVFGQGSQAQIVITFFVKKTKEDAGPASLHYADIADLDAFKTEDKLALIDKLGIDSIAWKEITPNSHGDWLGQRSLEYQNYMPLEPNGDDELSIFSWVTTGINTSRDAWVYGFSKAAVKRNVQSMINHYNDQLGIDDFDRDRKKISWSRALLAKRNSGKQIKFQKEALKLASYRPFVNKWLYLDKDLNEVQGLFGEAAAMPGAPNTYLCVTHHAAKAGHSALMSTNLPDFHYVIDTRCFPLHVPVEIGAESLYDAKAGLMCNISDETLSHFRRVLDCHSISKESIFHYVYAVLNTPKHKLRHADDMKKTPIRVPLFNTTRKFFLFSSLGLKLAKMHLDYEQVPEYDLVENLTLVGEALPDNDPGKYKVNKMSLIIPDDTGEDLSIKCNEHLTLTGIPREVLDYVVAGRPALWWVVTR